jgi:histidinol-phosphate aminotransferase
VPLWLMNYCWRVKQPYNVSVLAEEAACAALESKEYLQVKTI